MISVSKLKNIMPINGFINFVLIAIGYPFKLKKVLRIYLEFCINVLRPFVEDCLDLD